MLPSSAQRAGDTPAVAAQPPGASPSSHPLSALPPKPSVAALPRRGAQPRPARAPNQRSASWTPEEDAKLRQLVNRYISTPPSITASNTWSRVAQQLPRRTGKQCRERYLNQLRPGIRREPWTYEEETILNQVHARLGNKWVAIAKHLPGRTDNCVKNHWNSMLRKRQRRQAALKQTEKQVCHSLARSNRPSLSRHAAFVPVDNSLSSYPHSATPSEMSSHLNDFVSSGIPSPFTVSSPLTPHRDAKLQISSLVATRPSNEILACHPLHPITTSSSQSEFHVVPSKSDFPSPASPTPVLRYNASTQSTAPQTLLNANNLASSLPHHPQEHPTAPYLPRWLAFFLQTTRRRIYATSHQA
ncbi:Myb-like transcription factor [Gracilaria domingensis]|nr:Myb-like transcription factor [Gracilaria domingensis]